MPSRSRPPELLESQEAMAEHPHAPRDQLPQRRLKRSRSRSRSPESVEAAQSKKRQCTTCADDAADQDDDNWSVAASVGDDPSFMDDHSTSVEPQGHHA